MPNQSPSINGWLHDLPQLRRLEVRLRPQAASVRSLILGLALHRAPADIAATEAVLPFYGINQAIGCSLSLGYARAAGRGVEQPNQFNIQWFHAVAPAQGRLVGWWVGGSGVDLGEFCMAAAAVIRTQAPGR